MSIWKATRNGSDHAEGVAGAGSRNEIANLNRSYADKIAELQKKLSGDPENADLYYAQIAALEKELTSKISETNLSYQKLILEIDRQLRQLSDKSATELLAD